jgi:hypothetical protein
MAIGRPKVENKKKPVTLSVYYTDAEKQTLVDSGIRYLTARREATKFYKDKLNKILRDARK